jgi:hypothetical protein
MFHVAEKEFGGVDIVCPGAGVYEPVRTDSPDNSFNVSHTSALIG